ncbi:unnamed protein product [Brassica rapa subsp. narinosa]|uniref:Uncharacterized protein n=1 Tax=Brassica campestris TaxID=3711 RepID=M4F5L0_BRACM
MLNLIGLLIEDNKPDHYGRFHEISLSLFFITIPSASVRKPVSSRQPKLLLQRISVYWYLAVRGVKRRLMLFVVCGGVASQTSQHTAARKKCVSPRLNIMHQKIVTRVCSFQSIGCVEVFVALDGDLGH